MKVLITCPPMLKMVEDLSSEFARHGWEVTTPSVTQTLPETELLQLVPKHHGWIIGDDPATRAVFEAGYAGKLRAAVKWGVGVDNVDFQACGDLGIPIANTPGMFGGEVADLAVGYLIGLARQSFLIDREVRAGRWPKPTGISLAGKTVAVVGLGDIGRNVVRRLLAADMNVLGYDPGVTQQDAPERCELRKWPDRIETADFLVLTCALTASSHHLVNQEIFTITKPGLRLINVSRGPIVDECSLIKALETGLVHSAALDVFEDEPLALNNPLRNYDSCVFGSHNASNTVDAVLRTSQIAIEKLAAQLR